MRLNNISNTSFEGKFLISNRIKNSKAKYVQSIIDEPVDGITNKQLLENRTFNVHITPGLSQDKLNIFSSFRAFNLGCQQYKINEKTEVPLGQGILDGAKALRKHILSVDRAKYIHDGFNTFRESVKSCLLMMIGIY